MWARSGTFMGDGNAPDMFAAIFDERIEVWIDEYDRLHPSRSAPLMVEDLDGVEHRGDITIFADDMQKNIWLVMHNRRLMR